MGKKIIAGFNEVFLLSSLHGEGVGGIEGRCRYSNTRNYFAYFCTKTNVVGTQKNRLNETVLLSTQNICLN